MWEGKTMSSDSAKLNDEVFKRLSFRIYAAERDNFKTQKRKPNEMNDLIRKIIEVEVEKDAS
jgi:hypothetical protein